MPPATFIEWLDTAINWLDKHAGAATAILTATLVLVTVYYALQNTKMAKEMRLARGAAILPKLALDFHRLGPTVITPAIYNVGPGAALDVDVTLTWEAVEGQGAPEPSRWRRNVLSPGEKVDFMQPGEGLSDNLNTIPERFEAMRLTGKMRDAAGKEHVVDEKFSDIKEWRAVLRGAHQRWVHPDPEQRLADAFHKKFEGPLRNLTSATTDVARGVYRIAPPDDEN